MERVEFEGASVPESPPLIYIVFVLISGTSTIIALGDEVFQSAMLQIVAGHLFDLLGLVHAHQG